MSGPTPRRRLIIHVGQHKTGSTYIQKRLLDDRERLATHGVLYPSKFIEIYGHHQIPAALMWNLDPAVMDQLSARIGAEFSSYPTLVLSSENFCLLTSERLALVRDRFEGWDITVVYFVRRLSGFWPSHWQELIKHGLDVCFDEYLIATMQPQRVLREYPDQLVQLQTLSDVFGYESLSMIAFDNAMTSGVDLYDLLLERIIDVPSSAAAHKKINASHMPGRTELIRAINMRFKEEHSKKSSSSLRLEYMRLFREIEAAPSFAQFLECFEAFAKDLRIGTDHIVVEAHERELSARFGPRVVNGHAGDCIFGPAGTGTTTRYGSRYWISCCRAG